MITEAQPKRYVVISALIVAMGATPVAAQRVVDGDTIDLSGTRWRLWGVDAPESRQTCRDGWPAGEEATLALRLLVAKGSITCEERGRDRYRRVIGLCKANGQDLGAAMVSAGMAWAFIRYSSDYIGQEKAAINARLGIHVHDCIKAWDWRRQQK